jgi:hypothetical protein
VIPTLIVDFAKAFDSVEHGMIRSVMRYFGYGEVMTTMVMTLLNDRKSRVILEDGYSENIILERGTPQGDRSSPYIFIMCIEILLIKVRMENGNGIDDSGLYIEYWGRDGTDEDKPLTGEAYADDLTLIFKFSKQSVGKIIEVLENFGKISVLLIYIDKTQLMVVGTDNWATGERVQEIGIVDKVNILGVQIDQKLEHLGQNWEKMLGKMSNLCRHWSQFGLSIAGRVLVAKTYIMSQAVYLMGAIPMSEEIGNRINEFMLNYFKGNDVLIERRRQLLCAKLGGYGLVDANIMNVCIKASWLDRWKRESDKHDILARVACNGERRMDAWRVDSKNLRDRGMPIVEDIVKKWENFKSKFYEWGDNINMAELFGNSTLGEQNGGIGERIFGQDRWEELIGRIREIQLWNIWDDRRMVKSKLEVEQVMGEQISWAECFRLRMVIQEIRERYPVRVRDTRVVTVHIDEWVTGRKRGCKRYRHIMTGKGSRIYDDQSPLGIAAGITLWGNGMGGMSRVLVERHYGLWAVGILSAEYKEFLFRMVHGKLYMNGQRANFEDVDPICTFCGIKERNALRLEGIGQESVEYRRRLRALSRETVRHVFWECLLVVSVVRKVLNYLARTNDREVDRKRYMMGWDIENNRRQNILLIVLHYIKFSLYLCKMRRIVPTYANIRYSVEGIMGQLESRERWREGTSNLADYIQGVFV